MRNYATTTHKKCDRRKKKIAEIVLIAEIGKVT